MYPKLTDVNKNILLEDRNGFNFSQVSLKMITLLQITHKSEENYQRNKYLKL